MKLPLYYDSIEHIYYIVMVEDYDTIVVGKFPLHFDGDECVISIVLLSAEEYKDKLFYMNSAGEYDMPDNEYTKLLLVKDGDI